MIYDAAVIGAGIVGAMCARELSRYKLDICLLEKGEDVSLGATKANSAIVHAGFDAQPGTLKAYLNVRGASLMENTARELGVKYKKCGSLVVGDGETDLACIKELYNRGIKNGVRELRIIGRDELNELEPNIADNVRYALFAPGGAIICPYGLCIAAVGNAMDNGAELKTFFEVIKAEWNGDGYYTLFSSDSQSVKARYVINAAGMNADKTARLFGDGSFTLKPRRGEYMLLDRTAGGMVKHTVFRTPGKMGKGILVTPTVDGNVLLGPTAVDTTDRNDTSVTREGIEYLTKQSELYIKNLPLKSVITSFCGIRAVPSGGDFIINCPAVHFINAAGIESPGLSASPAIAQYVVGLLQKEGLYLEKRTDFNPTRRPAHWFKELTDDEKNEVIKREPAYGHIVCRCESISEGEIIESLHNNPPAGDLDGVKRRVRAGMGRCQGGFCSPVVMERIAKEIGVPIDKVKKRAKGR